MLLAVSLRIANRSADAPECWAAYEFRLSIRVGELLRETGW